LPAFPLPFPAFPLPFPAFSLPFPGLPLALPLELLSVDRALAGSTAGAESPLELAFALPLPWPFALPLVAGVELGAGSPVGAWALAWD
jgi:hypothetical protein